MRVDPTSRLELDAGLMAIFLDVDGTLLGFKDRPEDVVADVALRALLVRLADACGGALALVSGRAIADIDRIMAPLILPAAGTHGAELRLADGRRTEAGTAELDPLRAPLAAFVARHPNLRLEDKGAAIALHYRHAPDLADEVAAFVEPLAAEAGLAVQHGKMVADIKAAATSKGRAIEAMMATSPFGGRMPMFIGDDLTDEHGFEAVNALGGVSVKVGAGATVARVRLADCAAVRSFLEQLCPT